jgi:hypothetical protein
MADMNYRMTARGIRSHDDASLRERKIVREAFEAAPIEQGTAPRESTEMPPRWQQQFPDE